MADLLAKSVTILADAAGLPAHENVARQDAAEKGDVEVAECLEHNIGAPVGVFQSSRDAVKDFVGFGGELVMDVEKADEIVGGGVGGYVDHVPVGMMKSGIAVKVMLRARVGRPGIGSDWVFALV